MTGTILLATVVQLIVASHPRLTHEHAATPIQVLQPSILVSSSPVGADIELDGRFAGNTPSAVSVSAGQHLIRITKLRYKAWERNLQVTSGGAVIVLAVLERAQKINMRH